MADAWISQISHSDPGAPVAVQFRSRKGAVISVTLEADARLGDMEDAVAFARRILSQCALHDTIETCAPRKARSSCETDELYRFWATGR